jgi:hypothetical protein
LTSARTCPEKRRSLVAPTSRLATGVLQKKRLKPYRFAAQSGFDSVFERQFFVAKFRIKLHPEQTIPERTIGSLNFNLIRRLSRRVEQR